MESTIEKLTAKSIKTYMRIVKRHPYHWHDAVTIVRVIKGVVKLRFRSKDYILKKNDLVIFNVGEIHELEGSMENLVLVTHIDASFCRLVIKEFDTTFILCNSVIYEKKMPKKYAVLRKLYDALLKDINDSKACTNNEYLFQCAVPMLKYLCKEFDFISGGESLKMPGKKIIKRYKTIYQSAIKMNGNYGKISLKELAEHLDISYSHLKKDISVRYGHSYKWLKYASMVQHACKLILTTNDSIMHIGVVCGFSDPKYLIKYFKIFYKCTPSKFRSIYRDSPKGKNEYLEFSLKEFSGLDHGLRIF
jgi:AraC-like DNA-binding protein